MLSSSGVKDQLFIRGPSLEYVLFINLFDVIFWNQALIIRSKMKEVAMAYIIFLSMCQTF